MPERTFSVRFFFAGALLFFLCWNIATLLAQTADSLSSDIRISARVEQTQVPLNRTLKLHVTLSWLGDPDRYSILSFDNPALTNFDIVGTATASRTRSRNGQTLVERDYEYLLKPRELGMGYIEGVVVRCRDNVLDREQTLVTQRIPVEITDPVPEPGEGRFPWWAGVLIGILVLGSVGLLFFRQQQKKKKSEMEASPPPPVEDIYLDQLQKAVNLKRPDLKEDFAEISRLTRRYLAEKFEIPARETPTQELLRLLRETGLEEHRIESLGQMLSRCDEIKFSGEEGTPEELMRFYSLVEDLLNARKRADTQAQAPGTFPAEARKE